MCFAGLIGTLPCVCGHPLLTSQGDPTYDVLVQSPDPTCTAIAAVAAASSLAVDPKKNDTSGVPDEGEGGDINEELTGLSASDLSPLESFEQEGSVQGIRDEVKTADEDVPAVAESLKDQGNTLFKLGDTDAAAEMFVRVLRALERAPEVGGNRTDGHFIFSDCSKMYMCDGVLKRVCSRGEHIFLIVRDASYPPVYQTDSGHNAPSVASLENAQVLFTLPYGKQDDNHRKSPLCCARESTNAIESPWAVSHLPSSPFHPSR